MAWYPRIVTTSPLSGIQYRLADDRNRQWFMHFGADGSGFGYLTWRCQRSVGFDYPDLGHAYPVEMRKGPFRVLFSGQIVRIFERSGAEGDEIEVWALGWVHACGADVYNYIYCDTRLTRWRGAEDESGSFKPGRFDWDVNERLYLKPRRGINFSVNDYTYLRYAFPFGEVATRFVADYDLALPVTWPGKLEIRDSNGAVLWSATATASGSIDVTTTASPTYFEVRFYVTSAGENTATDDTVYGELTNVKVYSVNVTVLDAKIIADDLAAFLSGAAHGLGDDTGEIASPGLALEPAAFDMDMTPAEILSWCCRFGDSDGNPLAWGVTLDERRQIFLQTQDLTNVRYIVKPHRANLERGGDWGESAQVAYALYSDDKGEVQRTADRTRQSTIDRLGGYYRRVAVQISGTTDQAQVLNALDLWLDENNEPVESGSFLVTLGIWTPLGRFVPFDEVMPGGLVQVQEWRAQEATLNVDDFRDKVTTFELAGVYVDEDTRTVELVPRQEAGKFERYMAIIADLAG